MSCENGSVKLLVKTLVWSAVSSMHLIVFVLTFVQYFIPAHVNILIPSEVKIC